MADPIVALIVQRMRAHADIADRAAASYEAAEREAALTGKWPPMRGAPVAGTPEGIGSADYTRRHALSLRHEADEIERWAEAFTRAGKPADTGEEGD